MRKDCNMMPSNHEIIPANRGLKPLTSGDMSSNEQAIEPRIIINDADVIERFIATYDGADKTRETYRRDLRSWADYLTSQGFTLMQATRETVLEYRTHLQDDGRKASTINSYLTAVRRLYAWLEAQRAYPNIAADVKGLKRSKQGAKDALTKDQAKHLLSNKPQTIEGLRNYAILSLMIRAGLRTIEVARADYADIRQQGGALVLYVQGKGYSSKEDYVLLTDDAVTPIWHYLDARREAGEHLKDDSPLFASVGNRNRGGRMSTRTISRIVKRAMEREGIGSARLTAHSLRHTAVTFALSAGASLQAVQAMARHASINTTMIYAHNLDRIATAAERDIETYLAS